MLGRDSQSIVQRGKQKGRKDHVKRNWRIRWLSRWKKSVVEDLSHHSQRSNLSQSCHGSQVAKVSPNPIAKNTGNSLANIGGQRRVPHIAPLIFQFQRAPSTTNIDNRSPQHSTVRKQQSDTAMINRLEALQIQAQLMGDDHPDTIFAKNNIAKTHGHQNNIAIPAKNNLEKDSSSSASGSFNSVEGSNESSFPVRKIFLPSSPSARSLELDLSVSSTVSSSKDTVMRSRMEAIRIQAQMMGDHHPDTVFAMNKITSASGEPCKEKGAVRRHSMPL